MYESDQPKAVVVVNVSPGVFHRVSGVGAGEGTKVPTEFGAMHTGSLPCKCTVPSGWLDICLDNLAGDNGDGTPGGIGNMIQAFEVLAYCGSVWSSGKDLQIQPSETAIPPSVMLSLRLLPMSQGQYAYVDQKIESQSESSRTVV
jgi:hypothetical protein